MPTIHSSSRQFLLQLGVSRLPKSVDQTLLLHRDENFFQLPAPTIDNSLDNDIVEEDEAGLDKAVIANKKDRPGQRRITVNTDQNDTVYSKRKETSPTSVDNFPIDKSSDDLGAAADTTQGAYDVPIAERLKLRRKKSSAAKKDNTPTDGEVNTPKLNISLRKRKSLVLPGSEFNSSRKKRVPSGGIAKKKDAPVSNDISMSKSSRSLRKRKSSVLDSDKDSSTYTTSAALKAGGSTEESDDEKEEEETLHSKPELLAADLVVLPSHLRKKKASGHPLCKIKGCDKQGRSEKDEMCKAHYNTFKMAGRNTKETGEEVKSQLKSDCTVTERRSNRKKIAPELVVARPSILGGGDEEEDETFYPDVAKLKIVPKEDRLNNANGIPFCKVEGCPKQGRNESEQMCRSHFNMFQKAGRSSKETGEKIVVEELPPVKRGRGRPRKPSTSSQLSREATMQQTAEKKTMTLRKHRVKSSKLRTSEIGAEEDIGGEQKDQSEGKPTYNNSDIPIGVREMRSGNFEVSLSYHGQPRSIGTYTTLDDAVQANKVARSMLITERGVHLSVEQISTNIQSAKDAIKASGIAASNLSGQQSSNDIDFSSIGVYQTVAGSWTVIVCYQGKKRSMGTYRTKAEAALANKVARNFIAATRNSVLSIEESAEIAKLAKEAASKAVSEMMGNSEKHTAQAGKDTVGIRQIQSGNWSVKISFLYHGKQPTIGTFPTLERATLANKVAREMLQSTKDSALTEVQIEQNVKLAKEAASKAVSEMYSSRGSRDDDEPNQEPGTLSLGRWQSNEVFIEWLTDRKSKWKQDRQNKHPKEDDRGPSLVAGRWQTDKVFDEWLRDRKSKWQLQRPNRSATGNETSKSNTSKQPTSSDRSGPRAAGVYMTTSGNWEVRVRHQGSHITVSQSALAQEIIQGELDAIKFSSLLDATKFFSLSFEQRQLAKEAAVVVVVNELATIGKQVPASNTLQTLKKQNRMEVSDKIADINSEYWSKFIEEKKKEALLQNKIQLEMKRQVPALQSSFTNDDMNYATNEGGTSVFENLWEKRISANTSSEELEYKFFNGESNDQVVGLNSVRAVSLQNRKREEEKEKELRLREADAVGGLLSLNLNGIVSSNVPGKGIKSPTAKDVLRGRGRATTSHEGNMKLRDEARKLRGDYQDGLEGRSEKKYQYSLELVKRVKAYGGRFLEQRGTTDNLWYEMSEEDTRKKAAQVLREKRWE